MYKLPMAKTYIIESTHRGLVLEAIYYSASFVEPEAPLMKVS